MATTIEAGTDRREIPDAKLETGLGAGARVRDRLLRRSARLEVRYERALARALTVSKDKKLFQRLGFVRLSDYVRESIGISLRSAQVMIRTEKALALLPWTSFWWEMGTLHKEQVRLLCRVATNFTEQDWIFHAQRLSVRELAARVKEHADSAVAGSDYDMKANVGVSSARAGGDGYDEAEPVPDGRASEGVFARVDDGAEGEEEFMNVSFEAPLSEARRWRYTLRLCRDACEADLPDWSLVESLCAEYLSGLPPSSEAGTDSATCEDMGERTRIDAEGSATPALRSSVHPSEADSKEQTHVLEGRSATDHGRASGPDHEQRLEPDQGRASARDSRDHWRKQWLPRELNAFLDDLTPNDPLALHERIVRLGELRGRLEALLSHRLYEFMYRDEPRRVGHQDVKGYASEVLGIGERRARYLLGLERRLYGAPLVRDEYRRGGLSWLRCWMLLRVVRGEESESAWVEFAKHVTVLRLRDAVQDAEVRAAVEYPCLPPRIRGEESRVGERQVSARETSPGVNGEQLERGEIEAILHKRMGRIRFSAPVSIVALWRRTIGEARRVEGWHLREWEAVSKMLDGFLQTWGDHGGRELRHEHRIMQRDGWQCTVPACSSKQDLHAHHVKFRSKGGEEQDWNLTTLCAGHHLHAVHGPEAGTVTVTGRAPFELHWELGGGLGGPPAFVFEGERCVFRRQISSSSMT